MHLPKHLAWLLAPLSLAAAIRLPTRWGRGIVQAGMVFDVAGTASYWLDARIHLSPIQQNRTLLTMRSVIPGLWNPLGLYRRGRAGAALVPRPVFQ